MESIGLELNSIGENDFFSELNLACLLVKHGKIYDCNQMAINLFHLDKRKTWAGKTLESVLHEHPMAPSIISIAERASREEKAVSDVWDEVFYILAKKLNNDYIFIAIQDRTSEKKHEQLLLQKMQLESVSHLAAGVAHELRNPLSVIQGFIQLSRITNNFEKYYDTILSEINRMNQIIEDFLSISRKKPEKKYLKPKDLLDSLKALIESECLLHGIDFDYKLYDNDGYLYVNESMMKQVMLNLLRNTIEAYDKDTKDRYFRLHAGKDDDKFIMLIEDNGPGMSEQVMASLGEPFYTTKETGTGIGIPICQKIIKEHNGEFFIDSKQNQGTKITIQLPLSN